MNDGTFGTTSDTEPFDPEIARRIETHSFSNLRRLQWRNARLRYTSIGALKASLAKSPDDPGLVRARAADDEVALDALAKIPEVAALATTPDKVALLWDICHVPDFGRVMSDAHTGLLARIFTHVAGGTGKLPTDWIARNLERIDRTDGDIETLAQRISNVRTWTYISFHAHWLNDAVAWQEQTRAVEDKLSDALHERLTQRFVDKRTATLVKRMKDRDDLVAAVTRKGDVVVEGHFVGRLEGFRFIADDTESDANAKRAVTNAAVKALRGDIPRRVGIFEKEPDKAFVMGPGARILWRGHPIARLMRSADILDPAIEPLASDLLDPEPRERVRQRLASWLAGWLETRLGPLLTARKSDLTGPARGLIFQLAEGLGSAPRKELEPQIRALDAAGRRALRRLDIRIGRESVFMPRLASGGSVEARVLLWTLDRGLGEPPAEIPPGRVSVPQAPEAPADFYRAAGYLPAGRLAVRVDIVERLAEQAWTLVRKGPFAPGPEMLTLAGCSTTDMAEILGRIGFRRQSVDGEDRFVMPRPRGRPAKPRKPNQPDRPNRLESPFAPLRALVKPR